MILFNLRRNLRRTLIVCLFIVLWAVIPPEVALFVTIFFVWSEFNLDSLILSYVAIGLLLTVPFLQISSQSTVSEKLGIFIIPLLLITVILRYLEKDSTTSDPVENPTDTNNFLALFIEKIKYFLPRVKKLWRKTLVMFRSRAYSPLYLKGRARYIVFFMNHRVLLISLFVALLICYPFFGNGYIFALDMVWTPMMTPLWNADGLNSTYPVRVLIYLLVSIIPSFVVQQLYLFLLCTLLVYIPLRYLPFIKGFLPRLIAALLFTLNPFVYARLLSGQWTHLFGYALLPLLLHYLIIFIRKPDLRSGGKIAFTLFGIGLFSTHFLYIGILMSAFMMLWFFGKEMMKSRLESAKHLLHLSLACFGMLLILTSYFTLPALLRSAPLEERFDVKYYEAFASAPHGEISVYANTLLMGGFWGEGLLWNHMYMWPQDHILFPLAASVFLFLLVYGIISIIQSTNGKYISLFAGKVLPEIDRSFLLPLLLLGVAAYVTSLGASDTIFTSFNLFLYEHVPFWSGLRDSNKLIGVLALVYVIIIGVAIDRLRDRLETSREVPNNVREVLFVPLLLMPIIFGMYMWGGLRGQLPTSTYPLSWSVVSHTLDELPNGERVLVLPWHGYMTMPFAGNALIANPTAAYFGTNRVYAGKGVEFAGIHDQEQDTAYRALDSIISNAPLIPQKELLTHLKSFNISHILILPHPNIASSTDGLSKWNYFSDDAVPLGEETATYSQKSWGELLGAHLETIFTSEDAILEKVIF